MGKDIILDIQKVSKTYPVAGSFNKKKQEVLQQVSLQMTRGKTLALVGGSGSGKSTLSRLIMQLEPITQGRIFLQYQSEKQDITQIPLPKYAQRVQMIFQDPYSSLNPRKKIWQIISAPLGQQTRKTQDELWAIAEQYCEWVGLGLEYLQAFPQSLSGGQRQRVGIARALVLQPEVLILDEPLTALDPSIQAQMINLLTELKTALGLSYLFIPHDMEMVNFFADEIAVMHAGKIVEFGEVEHIFNHPQHQYTQDMLALSRLLPKTGRAKLMRT